MESNLIKNILKVTQQSMKKIKWGLLPSIILFSLLLMIGFNRTIPKTTWELKGEDWYFVSPNKHGKWVNYNKIWYLLDSNNRMLRDWQLDNGYWYFLDSWNGMKTGWFPNHGKIYYLDKNGRMLTGFQKIKNNWYFFDEKGRMVTGPYEVNGKWYQFDKDGRLIEN